MHETLGRKVGPDEHDSRMGISRVNLFLVTKCELKNYFSEDDVFSMLTKSGAALLICKSRCTLKIAHDEVPAYTIIGSQNCLKGF